MDFYKEEIERIQNNIKDYEEMLRLMPEDTVLGRICIMSLLKKERKKLNEAIRDSEIYNQNS